MILKKILRKKYYNLRKKKYFEIDKKFFFPLIKLIKSNFKEKKIKIALYYPSNFETNILKFLENDFIKKQNILLPVIGEENNMNFFSWQKNQVLFVNKFGMLEPKKSEIKIPDVALIPILAFDIQKYRLGYGKGYYDRYLKKFKNILTVGVAFSFQRHHKLPIKQNDVKLDYIITEKGIF